MLRPILGPYYPPSGSYSLPFVVQFSAEIFSVLPSSQA
jgi:hypothetical protein